MGSVMEVENMTNKQVNGKGNNKAVIAKTYRKKK